MILKLVSIYDAKAQVFSAPIAFPTNGVAERSFADEVNNPNSQYAKHPEDFTLFHIGDYDDATGKVDNLSTPYSISTAFALKASAS